MSVSAQSMDTHTLYQQSSLTGVNIGSMIE